jgi:membrane dipeptidase
MIVDAHTDVLLELVVHAGAKPSSELVLRPGGSGVFSRYWLPRLEAGGVGVQICPLYGEGARRSDARERALAQVRELERLAGENAERVCLAHTGADLDDPRLRLLLSMEGVEPLNGDPGAFDEWYGRGVRSVSLTWNHPNEFAGGIDTPGQGLTNRGRALVRRLSELDVIIDLAHASEQTWSDVLDEGVPFSVTHAGCRAVHDHPRNLSDRQLRGLAERGGVLGMMGLAFVVDPQAPTLSRWLDHFDHAVAVMGVEHVGLGADFVDQATPTGAVLPLAEAFPPERAQAAKRRFALDGFAGPEEFPSLVAALRQRGYDGLRLEALLSGNWLRILREALPQAYGSPACPRTVSRMGPPNHSVT